MVNGVSNENNNALQVLNAVRAFRMQLNSSQNVEQPKVNNVKEDDKDFAEISREAHLKNTQETNIPERKSITLTYKEQYISDFKQYISKYPGIQINDDDITYAMKFGRSILVDRSA